MEIGLALLRQILEKKCSCLLFPHWDYGPCAHEAARVSGGFGWISGCQPADWKKCFSQIRETKAQVGLAAATGLSEASSAVHVWCIQTGNAAWLVCWFCVTRWVLSLLHWLFAVLVLEIRVLYLLFVCFGWWHNFVNQAWLFFPLSWWNGVH